MAEIKLNKKVEDGLLCYSESTGKRFLRRYTVIDINYIKKGGEVKSKLIKIKFTYVDEHGYRTPIPNREKIESFKKRLDSLRGKRIMRGYHQV
jgi:hypothetical protein